MPTLLERTVATAAVPANPVRAAQDQPTAAGLQSWVGDDIVKACRSQLLKNCYDRWLKITRKGPVPLLKDIYGREEEFVLDDSMLLIQQANDFIYVHQGQRSIQKYGRSFRGVTLSGINGALTAPFLGLYNSSLRDMQPRYIQFKAEFSARHIRWERLILPLISDERQTAKFIMTYSEPLDDRLDILAATFDRSPIGMIAAAKAVGDNRSLDDAEILLVNARARTMLKIPEAGSPLKTVAELRTWIRDRVGWVQTNEPAPSNGRTTLMFKLPDADRRISVIVEPIDYFVVYHLVDMGS